MNTYSEITPNANVFDPISLAETEQVKLMNRIDRKYWFHAAKLQTLFDEIASEYYVLTIDNQRLMPYASTYFDSPQNSMYTSHHNGRLNRYKIRKRTYIVSGLSFLEVKHKNNKGRTVKNRIPCHCETGFSTEEIQFLQSVYPGTVQDLRPSLSNRFYRITLVNKNMQERCTIDTGLCFNFGKNRSILPQLTIVELKSSGINKNSGLALALRNMGITPNGFSKYAVGKCLTDPSVKHHAFKQKIRMINKLTA